jgi:hypothetical protein
VKTVQIIWFDVFLGFQYPIFNKRAEYKEVFHLHSEVDTGFFRLNCTWLPDVSMGNPNKLRRVPDPNDDNGNWSGKSNQGRNSPWRTYAESPQPGRTNSGRNNLGSRKRVAPHQS